VFGQISRGFPHHVSKSKSKNQQVSAMMDSAMGTSTQNHRSEQQLYQLSQVLGVKLYGYLVRDPDRSKITEK
jgi:hypothetical protein